MSAELREAQISDVPAIVALVQSAYRGETSRQGWTTEADLLDGTRTDEEEVAELISQPDNCLLLLENDKQLVASVHVANKPDHAYLGMFAVRPDQQGKGVGKQLLNAAEDYVYHNWACRALRMTVIPLRVELIDWYIRRGYQLTGETVDFPYGQARYGLPKRDDLNLAVLEKILLD